MFAYNKMTEKYHRVKQIKYIWLNSNNATVVKTKAANNVEFQWQINQDLNLSNRAKVMVCGFRAKETIDTGKAGIFRCKNIPNNQVIDTTNHSYPIIHVAKSPMTAGVDFEPIEYDFGESSNWRTINIIAGNNTDPEYGCVTSQQFILGLKFIDYEIEEVQPRLMETVRSLDYKPQDRVYNKLV